MPLNVSGICARIWFSSAPDTTITSARSQSAPKCPSCSGSIRVLLGVREREAPALPRSAQKCRPSDIGLLKHFGFGLIVSDCLLERIECHVHEINRAHIDAVELAVVLSGDTKERRIDLTRHRYDTISHDRRPHEVGNIAAGDACAPEILGSTL